jgi:hypothetical protein
MEIVLAGARWVIIDAAVNAPKTMGQMLNVV